MDRSSAQPLAVVIPGMQFGPHVPLLAFASRAAMLRGARVVPMSWRPPTDRSSVELAPWVVEQVTLVLDRLVAAGYTAKPLLVGKSLGSHAATVAAERALPAIWMTPLLIQEPVVRALTAATAPCLLVGGTSDPAWDGALARRLTEHVVEVDGADHGMWMPGPLAASAAVLGTVGDAVERFLDDVVVPAPSLVDG